MESVARDVYQWSHFSQEKQMDFNGHLILAGDRRLLVDPPPLSAEGLTAIRKGGPVDAIILTNRDHVREAAIYRGLFRTKILAPELDAPLMDISVDGTFTHNDRLPGGLSIIHLPDGKSPGESALLLERNGGVLILGDALIGTPPGSLNFLPSDKFADIARARAGVSRLLGYAFDTVLVGDGASITTAGKEAVRRAVLGGQ
jgi:glyoxylase-like metal-dependent hydrolase (beta-lactamase superfamily II)